MVAGGILLLGIILIAALGPPILTGLADFLVVSNPLQKAQFIFVLNGDYNSRPFVAARLYREGYSPQIAIAISRSDPGEAIGLRGSDTYISIGLMEALGVPADRILILPFPGGVTSTYDEARALRSYLNAHPRQQILLVTSAFHTRRARWIIAKELEPLPVHLEVDPAPYLGFDQTDWWTTRTGWLDLGDEYIKLLYYLIRYH
jgi:uncharacterized SAM-binding protein YcdF (DUF218 family)